MANILDDNTQFIEAPDNSAGGPAGQLPADAPMQAASGNIGGLQAALIQPSSPSPSRSGLGGLSSSARQPFGLAAQEDYRQAIMDRIRPKGEIESSLAERKGALATLQEANSKPINDWEPQKYIAAGMQASQSPWDASIGWRSGVSDMMQADKDKQALSRGAGIANAQAGMDFLNKEESTSNDREKNVLADAAKMFSATRFKNGGMLNVPGRGLVNLNDVDEQGQPRLVIESTKIASMTGDAYEYARKLAESKSQELNFGSGPDAADKKIAWIKEKAKERLSSQLAGMNVPTGTASAIMDGSASTSQGGETKSYIGNTIVDHNYLAMLKKLDPEASIAPFDPSKPAVDGTAMTAKHYADYVARNQQPKVAAEILPLGGKDAIVESNKAMAASGAKEYADVKTNAVAARQVLLTTQDLGAMPDTETGIFSKPKMWLGDVAAALGMDRDMAEKSKDLTIMNTQLERHVAQMLHVLNKGSAGDKDVEMYRAMLPNVRDQVAVYKYNLAHARAIAQRQLAQGDSYDRTTDDNMNSTDVRRQGLPSKNAGSNWGAENDRLGPNFIRSVDKSGRSTAYFRGEALEDTIRDTRASGSKKTDAEITSAFDKAWKNNPSLFQH